MKKLIHHIPKVASYFFILLFCYAAISKALDFENFQVQIGQSPLLSAYAGFVSYAIIILELLIVVLLAIPKTNLIGLYSSTALMSAFTIYIYLILNYSDFVPCSCGGILEKMGWTEHLIFNILCVVLGGISVWIDENEKNHPKRRTSIILGFSNLLSCLTIVFLFFSSEHIIKKDNNFTRRFLIHPVIEDAIFDLKVNSYYFSGLSENKIYLGNLTAPLLLTTLETDFKSFHQRKIAIDKRDFSFRNLQIQIFKDRFFLFDGTVPVIYSGHLKDLKGKIISDNDAYFTQLVPLDITKFALRTQSRANKHYTLAILNLQNTPKVTMLPGILQKQIDGVFDSDGFLIKKTNSDELIYTYSYRNEFMVMNKDFLFKSRLKTIDTVKKAQLKITELTDGRRKMSAPPVKINSGITANRNIIFIHSTSRAKNESKKAWSTVSVVDMYYTDRQEYAGSFYIKNRNGEKISKMIANDNYLFIIIGNELIRYRFTKPIKKLYRSGEAENLKKE